MANGLSNPSIEINDRAIHIVPNSLSIKRGKGDVNIRAQTAGGGAIEIITTDNAETRVSMVKFSVFPTNEYLELIPTWQEGRFSGGNTIRISDKTIDTPLSFTGMQITTDPEYAFGADTQIELEFMGDAT